MASDGFIDIFVKLREVMKCYIECDTASVSQILWTCFCADFQQHPQWREHADRMSASGPTILLPCEYGSLLHEYIARYYNPDDHNQIITDTCLKENPHISSKHIKSMLRRIQASNTAAMIDDRVYGLLRSENKVRLYRDLKIELLYFYQFANERKLVPYAIEFDITDSELRRVGRVNALFRMKRYKYADDKLMLYDWMRSRYMIPGSLTWMKKTIQLNIYKYILEKFYGKTIVKMVTVVLHCDNDAYEEIQIDDIGFHFDAKPKAEKGNEMKRRRWTLCRLPTFRR